MNKSQSNMRRHVVPCPHCGKDVLDHMTVCPFCQGKLKSRYYTPSRNAEQQKNLKRMMSVVGFAIAAVIIILMLVQKYAS